MAPNGRRFVVAVLTIIAALIILFLFIASPAAGGPQAVLARAAVFVPAPLSVFAQRE